MIAGISALKNECYNNPESGGDNMAKMIPSQYKPDTTSYGEQQIFHALEKLPDTYTVFHSYSLNSHTGKLFAEIDFVILCPQGVLCLEVKGGHIKCQDRQWHSYGGGSSRPIENPFTQAQTAAMALYHAVQDYFRTNRSIVNACFASGVAFPDISFNERGPEIRPEIVYDKNSGNFLSYIEKVFAFWQQELRQRFDFELTGLSDSACFQLEKYLCHDFDIVYTVGTRVDQVEKETIRLTEDQRQILNYVAQNPRILITGGAGTGKTILCLEQAQRRARSGDKVLFLCYNHNLSFHLHHRVKVQSPDLADCDLHVCAFYKYILQALAEGNHLPPQPPQSDREAFDCYWLEVLPQTFLTLPEEDDKYDFLVIDEGQDLLDPLMLQCMNKLLKGGLFSGRWLVAMDPQQNLYRTDLEIGLSFLRRGNPTILNLEDNYRNTKEIIQYTIESTGIDPRVNPLIQGLEIREDYYENVEDQRIKLVKALEQLKKEYIPLASICIVSLTSFDKSVLQGKLRAGKFLIQDLTDLSPEQWDPERVKFSSVFRFKGMESPVVIVTDVTDTKDDYATRCYTAMTRAKALLWVLKHESTKPQPYGINF
ncbi:MAG TPA: hypothetical protein DG577_02825 [Firmicutes bacterium]|jgi:hypothetical protein|nr:hypothetical protein [Bacillota bacterium]